MNGYVNWKREVAAFGNRWIGFRMWWHSFRWHLRRRIGYWWPPKYLGATLAAKHFKRDWIGRLVPCHWCRGTGIVRDNVWGFARTFDCEACQTTGFEVDFRSWK